MIDACRAAPAAAEPWILLALCLLCLGRFADLQSIIDLRQRQGNDGLKLFNDCLLVALEWSEHSAIRNIAAALPSNSALTVVGKYMAGIVDALDGDVDRGIGQIHEAAGMIPALPANLSAEPYIATIATEACLLAPAALVADIEQSNTEHLAEIFEGVAERLSLPDVPRSRIRENFIFLSSCDQRYLQRFGETVVRALDATGANTVYHLHIVDPSPDVALTVARLQEGCSSLTLNYTTETYDRDDQGYVRAEFYACSRLIRLPEILALYDRDIFMWDVDTNGVTDFTALIGMMEGFDLGYFRMKNTRLTLVSHLAAVYFANTASTRRLSRIIRNYIVTKFATTPFWLLDQASVYCASQFLTATDPDFRVRDFGYDGRSFASYVDIASSAEEKQSMRKAADRSRP